MPLGMRGLRGCNSSKTMVSMRVPQTSHWLASALWLCSCDSNVSSLDQIYSRPGDGPVTCGFNLDDKNAVSTDAINSALDRAQLEASVVHLYSHHAPNTVDVSTIALVVQAAETRGLRSTTYRELVADAPAPLQGALALSFDDRSIDSWLELLPLFSAHHTRVTFFISAFTTFEEKDLQGLRRLADAGHDIQYHSTRHENAVTYSDSHGIDQYVRDDIEPGLAAMRGAGFDPIVFAYPFGARNAELDQTLATYFPLLRGSHFSCPR